MKTKVTIQKDFRETHLNISLSWETRLGLSALDRSEALNLFWDQLKSSAESEEVIRLEEEQKCAQVLEFRRK